VADILELLETQRTLFDARAQAARSLAEWHSARLRLLAAAGDISEVDTFGELTRLRGFEGYDEAKPLILRGADPKGRHYTGVVDATCVAVIFGGACGGRASLSFSNRSCSSGSGWV
jgi:hypothetical protein